MSEDPIFLQFVTGIQGGISAVHDCLMLVTQTTDNLFGDQYHWSVIGVGAQQR